jgi:aspartate/methionine/tyrosine aminotransferase
MKLKLDNLISSRSVTVDWSGIRVISKMLAEMGKDVIHLGIGQPDFDTPKHIREEAKNALDQGYTRYPPARGFEDLREAIARKLIARNNIEANPYTDIFISAGAIQGIFNTILHLVEPGNEVILFDPGYNYYSQIRLFGGVPVRVVAHEKNKFKVDPADIRKAVTNKTRLLILNTPSNPTGAVFGKDILIEIAKIAQEFGILVLSDEPYEDIVYDTAHVSIASLDGMKDLTVSVFTFSKTYAMTGWRIGYVVANRAIIDEMEKIMEHMLSGVTAVSQRAALKALQSPQDCVSEMVRQYRKRRDILYKGLNDIDGVSCILPEATFYAFPNISRICKNSWDFAKYLIETQRVGTIPGSVFGSEGEGHLRISYATNEETIREGVLRIKKGIELFKQGELKRDRISSAF